MQQSETAGRVRGSGLDLDLRPPVRLDLWALLLAAGIVAGTVAPPLGVALVLASCVACAAVAVRRGLVPGEWRAMALLGPLFVAGGVGIAFLHATAFDPLLEFAAVEPDEVVVVGNVISSPVPTKIGYRADVRVEHLWYEEKEVLRGGGVQVYPGDMRVGVGDWVRLNGELKRPEMKEDGFDYGRYLLTRGISGLIYAKGVWPADEERGWAPSVPPRPAPTSRSSSSLPLLDSFLYAPFQYNPRFFVLRVDGSRSCPALSWVHRSSTGGRPNSLCLPVSANHPEDVGLYDQDLLLLTSFSPSRRLPSIQVNPETQLPASCQRPILVWNSLRRQD